METLHVLEQRITQLISLVKKLQEENAQLVQKYMQSVQKLESLESALLHDSENLEKLHTEREHAISTVDELIKSIDTLVGQEQLS